jgi:hypothetical protein
MNTSPDWTDIPEPGEPLLWAGRPDTRLHFGIETAGTAFFGAIVIAASSGAGWLVSSQTGGVAWPFVAGGIGFALFIIILFPLMNMLKRRKTRYAVTDRRALIRTATKRPRQPDEYRLNPDSVVTYHPGTPATIWFAEQLVRGQGHSAQGNATRINVGFERIADGETVYQLLRDVITYNKTT